MPVSLGMILLIGIATSLIQMRQRTNLLTNAESLTTIQDDCTVSDEVLKISQEEQQMLDQVNAYRMQYGLSNLKWSDSLVKASKWMSRDMLTNKYLGHIDSLGRDLKARLSDCGYSSSNLVAENIDSGQTAETTLAAWKHSPAQNANLLNDKFKEAGIAYASDPANDAYYWTLDLGDGSYTTNPSQTPIPSPVLTPILSPTTTITPTPTQIITPSPTRRPNPTSTPRPTITPTSVPYPGFTPNPLDTQILVSAKIIGIGTDGNRNPRHLTRSVTVEIYDMQNQLVKKGYGFIIFDRMDTFRGIIHFGTVDNGTYFIKILTPHLLKAAVMPTFQVLDNKRLNILPNVSLVQGDIDDDNIVNINDYNLALGCFQNKKCPDKDLIDFNDDMVGNIIDYNILLRNYWKSQGD